MSDAEICVELYINLFQHLTSNEAPPRLKTFNLTLINEAVYSTAIFLKEKLMVMEDNPEKRISLSWTT